RPVHEKLRDLKLVLGGAVTETQLGALLRKNSYNVEQSLNYYFDRGLEGLEDGPRAPEVVGHGLKQQRQRGQQKQEQPKKSEDSPFLVRKKRQRDGNPTNAASHEAGWPKLLCELTVEAESTTRLDEAEVRQAMPPDSALRVSADQQSAASRKSSRGSADGGATVKSVRRRFFSKQKKAESAIVRISVDDGHGHDLFLGRLPRWLSARLGPLLQEGMVDVQAKILGTPPSELRPFTMIPVELRVFVLGTSVFNTFPKVDDATDTLSRPALAFFELLQIMRDPTEIILGTARGRSDLGDKTNEDGGESDEAKNLSDNEVDGMCKSLFTAVVKEGMEDPPGLSVPLRPHQRTALRWMLERERAPKPNPEENLWTVVPFADAKRTPLYVNMYTRRVLFGRCPIPEPLRGGILADEMGLGKTVCIIALLMATRALANAQSKADLAPGLARFADRPEPKDPGLGTLIVCPTSLLGQWHDELVAKVARGCPLRVVKFHDRTQRAMLDLGSFDCVITTYGVVASEMQQRDSSLLSTKWYRVVLDEAHVIKNRHTDISKATASISATNRWCLTGTPLQNSVDDLFSLFFFLRHEPWSSYTWWSRVIRQPFEQTADTEASAAAMERLRAVLNEGPLMLRRVKADVQGMAMSIPERHIEVVKVDFTESERSFYEALYSRSKAEFDGFVSSGSAKNKYAVILTLLLRLRQACDHPFLVLANPSVSTASPSNKSQRDKVSDAEYINGIRQRLFHHASAGDNGATAAGSSAQTAPARSEQFIASTLEQISSIEEMENRECPICLDPPDEPQLTSCGHILCRDCLYGAMRFSRSMRCPVCRESIEDDKVTPLSVPSQRNRLLGPDGKTVRSRKDLMSKHWRSSSKLNTLIARIDEIHKVNQALSRGAFASAEDPAATPETGALLRKLVPAVSPGKSVQTAPVKVLVFSQWTKMLDMIEDALRQAGISSGRLDGSMSQGKRERCISEFTSSKTCNVFLISLKAGSLGLNLVCASVVFLVDAWWNPAVEEQAINRVHRIGQTRPVFINRLIVPMTVEEKIMALQERKAAMATAAVDNIGSAEAFAKGAVQRASTKLSLDDLMELFNST
ncbi:DNA repair protein RAD5B (Putative SWI/SNF-related matrix-associated actin-dependent regulator of chromatin subfamily A member 3-like 3) (SMARCA3-like protein 3) (RAD5 homolog B) (AtRAD5B), partial [Durusdinium trenchii]